MYERRVETMEMLTEAVLHEIKNPLAMIRVCVDYMELCDADKNFEKHYQMIRGELNKVNGMILEFVNLLKPASEFDEIVRPWEGIEKTVENFYEAYGGRIQFQMSLKDRELVFYGNVYLFEMVISNIIKNAVEAMNGMGEVRIRVYQDSGNICMEFQDTGCGLDYQTAQKINEGKVCTTKEYGSGLGIRICKKIMQAHQGYYEIRNSDEGGCIVKISIPQSH